MVPSSPLEHVSVAPEGVAAPVPAVVLLHGRGADERDLLSLAERLPDDRRVISFRAPRQLGAGYTWYDLDLSAGSLQASQPDEPTFTDSLEALETSVRLLVERYDLDPDRVGFLGFSQGAILAMSLLLERPALPEWVVGLHGYLPARYETGKDTGSVDASVWLSAGEHDEIIPEHRVRDAADRLAQAGCDVTFRTYAVDHRIAEEELADMAAWIADRLDED